MSTAAIVTMIIGFGITWGGAAWCLRRAFAAGRHRAAPGRREETANSD